MTKKKQYERIELLKGVLHKYQNLQPDIIAALEWTISELDSLHEESGKQDERIYIQLEAARKTLSKVKMLLVNKVISEQVEENRETFRIADALVEQINSKSF